MELGHRRIAYLGAAPGVAYNQARMQGYRAALEAAGSRCRRSTSAIGSEDYEAGVAGEPICWTSPRPDGRVRRHRRVAAGVVEAARVRGLHVPEDLSIVGFDDTEIARLLSPPLTTVRQPLREMGRVALGRALRLAAGEKLDSHHVELATELIVRSSTAPPPRC